MHQVDLKDTLFAAGYGASGVGATLAIDAAQSHETEKFWLMAGYFVVSTLVILIKQVIIPLIETIKSNKSQ